ncbi:MAG: N-acetyl-alpha-D-glucosaminyl L-malate deacetylase 1 [Chloroflexi bacterium]|nr:N-acetyl-alpha-D-glucosaminyl L-malate deacetylase 1 [Chloroflexota bacterium]
MTNVDVMAFGAHPDDIEITCGGTLIKLVDAGYSVAMVDMVRGEMGTRGTVETREKEAAKAAEIIGAVARENLGLEDANLHTSKESKNRVVEVVRKYRPRLVFIPYYDDRHPDHYHASEIAYEGTFLAGLTRYETGQESYRPPKILYYMSWYEFDPTFIVDITEQFERKMEAIYAYSTQFKPEDNFYKKTRLTSREYNWGIRHRMGYYGSKIGKKYGEGFLIKGKMEVKNPLDVKFSTF